MVLPFWVVGAIILVTGCLSGCEEPVTIAEIKSSDPVRQARAIKLAAMQEQMQAVPDLIDLLEDEDPGVQTLAITSLREITGEHFGFKVWTSRSEKAEAIERWRRYAAELETETSEASAADECPGA